VLSFIICDVHAGSGGNRGDSSSPALLVYTSAKQLWCQSSAYTSCGGLPQSSAYFYMHSMMLCAAGLCQGPT
jgi:hypothetical protein